MAKTTYQPKPMSAEDVAWFEQMMLMQANVQAVNKVPKKKKPKDKK
jgi:hypothetical protein